MATTEVPYTHPYFAQQMHVSFGPTTAGATTTGAQTPMFHAGKLRRVAVIPLVAGTTATTHGYDVFVGTASVGQITVGTAAANSAVQTSSDLNASYAAGDRLSLKSLTDATGTVRGAFLVQPAVGASLDV